MPFRIRSWLKLAIIGLSAIGGLDRACGFSSKESLIFGIPFHNTHSKLTRNALANIGAFNASSLPYPDIGMYREFILMGSITEGIGPIIGAHKSPDNDTTWWYGNETNWLVDAAAKYDAKNFERAYLDLGFRLHLFQDAQVPAHQTITYHGFQIPFVLSGYVKQPSTSGHQSPPKSNLMINDELESFVSYAYHAGFINDTTSSPVIWQNTFTDANGCPWYFWLDQAASGNPNPSSIWGDYGQGTSPGCTPLSWNQRDDWFAEASSSTQTIVAQPQLYWARKNSEDQLIAFSAAMKPFITNLTTSGGPLGAGLSLDISFHIMENRTQNVTFTAKVLNTDASDTGKKAFDAMSLTLNSGTSLPWEKDVTLTWDGTPTSGSLADGSYLLGAFVVDGDSKPSVQQNSGVFIVDKSSPGTPGGKVQDALGNTMGDIIASSHCVVIPATDTVSGIASIALTGPPGFSTHTVNYECSAVSPTTAAFAGPFCQLGAGDYSASIRDCAGNARNVGFTISTVTVGVQICMNGAGGLRCSPVGTLSAEQLRVSHLLAEVCAIESDCNQCPQVRYDQMVVNLPNSIDCGGLCGGVGCCRYFGQDVPNNFSFTVSETTGTPSNQDMHFGFKTYRDGGPAWDVCESTKMFTAKGEWGMPANGSYSGHVTISQVGQGVAAAAQGGGFLGRLPFAQLKMWFDSLSSAAVEAYRRLVLRPSSSAGWVGASEAIFNSTGTITFSYQDVNVDTTTLRVYRFDGVGWSSASVTNQYIYISSTGVITATGTITRTGLFMAMFDGHDSSAPITTFSIEGSSRVFTDTLFISTFSYAVLTATDPAVNGYASQVSTIYYRLDASSSTTPFSVYSSSIPLPLGTHVLEYRSYDYAGNAETVKTTTFTVTAGTAFKNTSDHRVAGKFLAGLLGSGARAEVESRAEDSYTLLISSPNRQVLLSASNIGGVGVGVDSPEGRLDLGVAPVALQLRSGNTVSTGAAVQVALGYDGDQSMRHAIRTHHGATATENRMDFLVWSPAVGSTATIAQTAVMSLQGLSGPSGSMHVRPFGTADAQLEVSSGTATGGGTMQRWDVLITSSRRFKSDIKYLGTKEEDRAFEEVAGLRHVRFRYKTKGPDGALRDDPAQPVHVGMIYEEMPEALQGEGMTILVNERLAEVELALKAAIRRTEELEARYKALKEGRARR